jgi:hypothetical protein
MGSDNVKFSIYLLTSEERTASIFRVEMYWSGNSCTLKMEMALSPEASAIIYQSTWCHIREDSNLHNHCHENLIFHNLRAYKFNNPYICYACKLSAVLCYNRLVQTLHEPTQKACLSCIDVSQY